MASPLVDDLARLVAFPSVSNRPLADLAAYLAHRFEDLGFRIERFDDPAQSGKCSLIATAGPSRGDGSGLVLSGHMDVVPTEGQPWSSDPFVLTERGGNLYGRGSADMKGFFACTLQALERVRTAELKRELVLAWTHDEEVGCLGSAQLAQHLVSRTLPRACLIGEPTDFRILRMHPGHVGVSIAITGKAAHSSRPHLGVNAIEAAADVIGAIREIARELGPDVPVNVARIEGGGAINIVPDRCVIHLGYRPPPGMPADEVFRRIDARLADFSSNAPVEAKLLRVTPSMLTREGTPLEHLLAEMADEPGTGMAPFATDGGNLAKLGLEPLVFGPGSIEVAHKADEHVGIAALERGVDMVERVIRSTCL
jgi:acetylornithine deacetylase